jgi:hypothetical protein
MYRRSLALALIGPMIAAAGCGGSGHQQVNPERLLDAAAAHPISSAQTQIDLRMQVDGVPRLSGPLGLRLQGPYVSGEGKRIPSFDWRLSASALGFPVGGRVASTGTNVYLSLYGDNYEVGADAVAAANERIRAAAGSSGRSLGLHPRDWFGPARVTGDGNEGGADCERISAPLRGDAMARDLAPLAGSAGFSEPPRISGRARACVGYDDRVFHELQVDATVELPPADRALLAGASAVHLHVDVVNSDVGEPQRISIPGGGGYRPIRDLALTLNDLGVPIPL